MVALDPENAALLAAEGVTVGDVIGVCGATGAKPRPLIPYYGGKARMAPIIAAMIERIPHRVYIEPFCGAFGVLAAKRPSEVEIINDLHAGIVTLFRVVKDRDACHELVRRLELTPYARDEWRYCNDGWEAETDPIEKARMVYVTLSQNFVGRTSGGSWSFGGGQYKGNVSNEFYNSLPNIAAVAQRVRGVLIENAPALNIIGQWETAFGGVVSYEDPPYLEDTRNSTGYRHEMTSIAEHTAYLENRVQSPAAVIISGYPHTLYTKMLEEQHGWVRIEKSAISSAAMNSVANGRKNNTAAKSANRVECLWLNPLAQHYQQHSLWEGLSA